MDDEFLEEFASNQKICKQIHVPLQSGSTRVLKRMKRGYSKEWFLQRCEKIRELVPNVAISTDIIVGFPGESDDDFAQSMEVLHAVEFEQLFSFRYSARPHTQAIEFEDTVPQEVAAKRLKKLQDAHNKIAEKKMKMQLGATCSVYFEELKPDGLIAGRSDEGRLVFTNGSEEFLGQIAQVRIDEYSRTSLRGKIVLQHA